MPAPAPLLADVAAHARLAAWLAGAVGAAGARVVKAEKLPGGAVQENWGVDVEIDGGARTGRHALVLRADAPATISVSLDRATEFAVLTAAHKAGVLVAAPIARCADSAVLGRPFLLQQRAAGAAQARRLVRDPALPTYGEALATRLGEELARIHTIAPPEPTLSALPIPLLPPARAEVARLRAALDKASEARPALEYALAWLDRSAPATPRVCLCHGDYRTGNYMVENGALTAVLDWEFAHWGDPHEDIGWLMARCWRFGNDDREAGGIGSREAFVTGYERVSGSRIDRAALPYWEILAATRWGTIAVLQADRYRVGGEETIELALTGLMVPEMELDALDGIIAIDKRKGGRR